MCRHPSIVWITELEFMVILINNTCYVMVLNIKKKSLRSISERRKHAAPPRDPRAFIKCFDDFNGTGQHAPNLQNITHRPASVSRVSGVTVSSGEFLLSCRAFHTSCCWSSTVDAAVTVDQPGHHRNHLLLAGAVRVLAVTIATTNPPTMQLIAYRVFVFIYLFF